MAWTPSDEANLQALKARAGIIPTPAPQPEQPGLFGYAARETANVLPSALEKIIQPAQVLMGIDPQLHGEIPRFFDQQAPQGLGQNIVHGAAELASYLPAMIGTEGLGAAGLEGLGASQAAARVGGAALGWGLPMAPEGGEQVGVQGAVGALQSAAQTAGWRGKVAAGLIGGGLGYYEGQKQSPEAGLMMGALNLAGPTVIDPLVSRMLGHGPTTPTEPPKAGSGQGTGTQGPIPFNPGSTEAPPPVAPMQLGGTGPLQPSGGIPFYNVPPPLDIGGGRPIVGQPANPGIPAPNTTGVRNPSIPVPSDPGAGLTTLGGGLARREMPITGGPDQADMMTQLLHQAFPEHPGQGTQANIMQQPLPPPTPQANLTSGFNPPGEGGLSLLPTPSTEPRFGGLQDLGMPTVTTPRPGPLGSERTGFLNPAEVPAPPVAPLQTAPAAPTLHTAAGEPVARPARMAGPHVISTLVQDNETGKLHVGEKWNNTHNQVKAQDPSFLLASKFDLPGDPVEATHAFLVQDEAGRVRVADRDEAGRIADLAGQRDAEYADYPLQSEHLNETKGSLKDLSNVASGMQIAKNNLKAHIAESQKNIAPFAKNLVDQTVGKVKVGEIGNPISEGLAPYHEAQRLADERIAAQKAAEAKKKVAVEPTPVPAPEVAPVAKSDMVRVRGRFGVEDAKVVGREGNTLHVEIEDPVFGKRTASVLESDTLPVLETPHGLDLQASKGTVPFKDVESLPLTGKEGAHGTLRGGSEGEMLGAAMDEGDQYATRKEWLKAMLSEVEKKPIVKAFKKLQAKEAKVAGRIKVLAAEYSDWHKRNSEFYARFDKHAADAWDALIREKGAQFLTEGTAEGITDKGLFGDISRKNIQRAEDAFLEKPTHQFNREQHEAIIAERKVVDAEGERIRRERREAEAERSRLQEEHGKFSDKQYPEDYNHNVDRYLSLTRKLAKEDEMLGSVMQGPGPEFGKTGKGRIPGRRSDIVTVAEGLAQLPKEAATILGSIMQRWEQAAGRAIDTHFSYRMPNMKGGMYPTSGRVGLSLQWVNNVLHHWDTRSAESQAKALMKITKTFGHEITHVAQRFGEASQLQVGGRPLLDVLVEQVHALSPSQRLNIQEQIARAQSDFHGEASKYLAGDFDTVKRNYERSWGRKLTDDEVHRAAAGEVVAEIGSIELARRANLTGLPTEFRSIVDKFKEVLMGVLKWFKGQNLSGEEQALASLQKTVGVMLDHFRDSDQAAAHSAFPAHSAGSFGAPPTTPHIPTPSVPAPGGGSVPPPAPPAPPAAPAGPPPPPPSVTVQKPFLASELARLGARSVAGAAVGGYLGPKFDQQISTAEGALLGGVAGAFGPAIAKKLLSGSLPEEVAAAFKASPSKPLEAMIRVFGGGKTLDELGREARFGWTGAGTTMAKFVRFFEAEFNLNLDPKLKAIIEAGRGAGTEQLALVQDALDKSRWFKPNSTMRDNVEKYFNGQMSKQDFEATLSGNEAVAYGNFITTAREGMTTLTQMFASGMPKGKFQNQLMLTADKYLGRFYTAYKKGEFNMAAFDKAKADYQRLAGVDAINADDHLREHMREVQANRSLFGGRRGNSGQKIDSSLTFRRLATEQEIEAQQVVVGGLEHDKYSQDYVAAKAKLDWMETHKITDNWREWLGEIKDPVERMIYSFQKVHASAISGKIFDLLDNHMNSDGLRFAYTEPELTQQRAFLEHAKTMPNANVASLQSSLDKLSGYGQLPEGSAYGRLALKYVDRFTRDEINTYATPFKWMEQPILRGIASFNNHIKLGRTAFNPLTVVRNYMQMPVFGLIAKTTAGDVGEAFKEIHHLKGDTYRHMLRNHIIGADYISSELDKGPGYIFSGTADADIAHKVGKFGVDKILKFYQQPDMLIRAGAWISARRRFAQEALTNGVHEFDSTGAPIVRKLASLQEAMDHASTISRATEFTNRYTMNYATVPRIVKIGRQLPFVNLFISYTSEMTRILKNLTEDAIKPGVDSAGRMHAITTLSAMAAIPAGIIAAAESNLSPKDREDWAKVRALQPDYARARFMIPTGRDADGRFHYFDITNLLPADNYSSMIKSFAQGDPAAAMTANPLASLQNTPLLNIAAEQIAGKDLRTNRDMVGTVGRVNEVLKEILPPILPPGYEGTRLANAFSTNAQGGTGLTNLRTGVDTRPGDIIANYFTGMRFGNVQLESVQRSAVGEAKGLIAQQQQLMRDVTNTNASPQAIATAQNHYIEAVKQIMLQLDARLNLTPGR